MWTRLVMESEANGKETVTFSTATKPASLSEEKHRKEGRRRNKPAKVKRDRERREAWLERRRTVEGRSVDEVPAAAPITEPAPKTPDGTCRTMVTGRTPEEAERRRPMEERSRAVEPVDAPVKEPAPVTVPRTPDGTWRVMEAGPQGGGPRRGFNPMTRYFGGFHGDRERRAPSILLRKGSWNRRI